MSRGRRLGNWTEVSVYHGELDGIALAIDHLIEMTENRLGDLGSIAIAVTYIDNQVALKTKMGTGPSGGRRRKLTYIGQFVSVSTTGVQQLVEGCTCTETSNQFDYHRSSSLPITMLQMSPFFDPVRQ